MRSARAGPTARRTSCSAASPADPGPAGLGGRRWLGARPLAAGRVPARRSPAGVPGAAIAPSTQSQPLRSYGAGSAPLGRGTSRPGLELGPSASRRAPRLATLPQPFTFAPAAPASSPLALAPADVARSALPLPPSPALADLRPLPARRRPGSRSPLPPPPPPRRSPVPLERRAPSAGRDPIPRRDAPPDRPGAGRRAGGIGMPEEYSGA